MYLDADECIDNPDACVAEDQSGGAATTPGSPCYGNYFVATGQESCPDWSDDPQQAGAGCGITRGQYYSYDCLTQSGGQSVSYTHLDVYKRQRQGGAGSCR